MMARQDSFVYNFVVGVFAAVRLLLGQGVPLKVVSETLGHSSIRITADVYGHLLEPARDEAAEAMERALFA